jgi:hypothetical protein
MTGDLISSETWRASGAPRFIYHAIQRLPFDYCKTRKDGASKGCFQVKAVPPANFLQAQRKTSRLSPVSRSHFPKPLFR